MFGESSHSLRWMEITLFVVGVVTELAIAAEKKRGTNTEVLVVD